jgi:hypothetical protein
MTATIRRFPSTRRQRRASSATHAQQLQRAREAALLRRLAALTPSVQQFVSAVTAVIAEHGRGHLVELCTDVVEAFTQAGAR